MPNTVRRFNTYIHPDTIRKRFDAASGTYDNAAHIQKRSANFLVSFLRETCPHFKPSSVLDLGSGTGFVPEILLKHYPDAHYTLNDISPCMTEVARHKFFHAQNMNFITGDMTDLKCDNHELTISNFALQWTGDPVSTIKKYTNTSKVVAFSCLIDGTFNEWYQIISGAAVLPLSLNIYPTEASVRSDLRNLGTQCNFEAMDFVLEFPNPHAFLSYLRSIGATATKTAVPFNSIRAMMADKGTKFRVTYRVFFALLTCLPDNQGI